MPEYLYSIVSGGVRVHRGLCWPQLHQFAAAIQGPDSGHGRSCVHPCQVGLTAVRCISSLQCPCAARSRALARARAVDAGAGSSGAAAAVGCGCGTADGTWAAWRYAQVDEASDAKSAGWAAVPADPPIPPAHIHTHIHTHTRRYTQTHTHPQTRARTPPPRAHTHTHTHTHTHLHAHTHTHTHTHTHIHTETRTHLYKGSLAKCKLKYRLAALS